MQEIRIFGPGDGSRVEPRRAGFRPAPQELKDAWSVRVTELDADLEQLFHAVYALADRLDDLERPWYRRLWENLPWARRT